MDSSIPYQRLPVDPCLTEEQLQAYLDGRLLPAAQYAVERHILDCPFCADALEGWQKVGDRAKVAAQVMTAPLTKPAFEEENKVIPIKRRTMSIWIMTAAAVLITALVAIPLIWKTEHEVKQVADVPTNNEEQLPAIKKADSVSITESNSPSSIVISPSTTESRKDEIELEQPVTSTFSQEENYQEKKRINTELQDSQDQASYNKESAKPIAAQEKNSVSTDQSDDALLKRVESESDKEKKELVDLQAVPIAEGADSYNTESKSTSSAPAKAAGVINVNSIISTDSITQQSGSSNSNQSRSTPYPNKPNSRDIEDAYTNGLKLLGEGKANAAIAYFDVALSDKKHPRYADAQWQKARALIQLNRKTEAKELLQNIVNGGGVYKTQAEEELKKL